MALSDILRGPLYRLYERRLLAEIKDNPLPRHVGIILDGNRRHGRESGLTDPSRIYEPGAQKLDDVLEWCSELAIPAVTLWVCSTDNLARPPEQVSGILAAVEAKLRMLTTDPRIHARRVRVDAIGRLDLLPPGMLEAIANAKRATADYGNLLLTIAIGYGGREEIIDAVRALLSEHGEGATLDEMVSRITPETLREYLYMPHAPDPDLIIRTSGEIRLSGFLLWQSAYSEFYFADVYWPAFRRIDLLRAIRSFQSRNRRFGR
ncbi:MAG: polyprenyl diphosphate synthase [Rhodospirillales bacterium]|nr:polyprenyl diphosphate synthase [Rhodospirillales bacterium]